MKIIRALMFKPHRLSALLLLLVTSLTPLSSQAWQHAISVGYGGGPEFSKSYTTSGAFINGVIYKWGELDKTLIFTVDGSAGFYHASTKTNTSLQTAALSGAFRAYFLKLDKQYHYRPYLLASVGPVYLSHKTFGEQTQGAHLALQSVLGTGIELGDPKAKHNYEISWRFVHICNAGIFSPNQGSDVYNIISLGWLF